MAKLMKFMKMLKRPAVLGAIVGVLVLAFVLYGSYEGFQEQTGAGERGVTGPPGDCISYHMTVKGMDLAGAKNMCSVRGATGPPGDCPKSVVNWSSSSIRVPVYIPSSISTVPMPKNPKSTELAFPSADANGKLTVTYSPVPVPSPCGDSQDNAGHLDAIYKAFTSASLAASAPKYRKGVPVPPSGYDIIGSSEYNHLIKKYVLPSIANLKASLAGKVAGSSIAPPPPPPPQLPVDIFARSPALPPPPPQIAVDSWGGRDSYSLGSVGPPGRLGP